MSHLIKNPKDLFPYADLLIKAFFTAIGDTSEEIRAIVAKSLAEFTKALGIAKTNKIMEMLII